MGYRVTRSPTNYQLRRHATGGVGDAGASRQRVDVQKVESRPSRLTVECRRLLSTLCRSTFSGAAGARPNVSGPSCELLQVLGRGTHNRSRSFARALVDRSPPIWELSMRLPHRWNDRLQTVVVAALVALVATAARPMIASAQDAGGAQGGGGRGGRMMAALFEGITLTDAERKSVDSIRTVYQSQMQQARSSGDRSQNAGSAAEAERRLSERSDARPTNDVRQEPRDHALANAGHAGRRRRGWRRHAAVARD